MEPQPDQDLDIRLQKLEAELNQTAAPIAHTASEIKKQTAPQPDQEKTSKGVV